MLTYEATFKVRNEPNQTWQLAGQHQVLFFREVGDTCCSSFLYTVKDLNGKTRSVKCDIFHQVVS